MAKPPIKPKGRYEIRDVLGEGGMGVVYRAFDPILKREVTLKTIRDPQDTTVLELFKRECDVLAGIGGHPNIVEIFDIGEIDDGNGRKPYFVMPLLKGVTLDQLIKNSSPRLTIERCIQMIGQMCRGLQAAHDSGLVHRDLKPSNIFVLEDDSIKIIDFGVAHLIDQRSSTGLKGTLLYMAPEQLQMKKPTPVSDQFSLAVISYEMLTRRHPFNVPGHADLAEAILTFSPSPASEINPVVSQIVSQVIHKALAKEPIHRFANVREFAECLQKALHNEPIEIFDPSRVEPRLLRAQKAFAEGDVDFASEIIRELKSESYLNPEIDRLDKEIADASRNKSIKQLMDTARRRFEENEHLLALQKVQEVLSLDPTNLDAKILQGNIENSRNTTQVEEWLRLAQRHLDNHAYTHARQAMEKLLEKQPNDARARAFLTEIDRQEQDSARVRAEKQQAYQSALESFKRGDVDSALSKLERCVQADKLVPPSSADQATAYQKLYEEVRSKRDHLKSQEEEAKRLIADGKYSAALTICSDVLKEYPENILFNFLRGDAEQGQRKELSAFVAKVETDVAEEPDLDRRIAILEDAKAKHPGEQRFEQSLAQVRSRKDLVDGIVAKAHALEEAGQFSEASTQWATLGNIHPQYPGLKVEIERLEKRRVQQAQAASKARWVAQVDQAANVHNYMRASSLVKEALTEFPGDAELLTLEQTVAQLSARQTEAEDQLAKAKTLDAEGKTTAGIELLRAAHLLVPQHQAVRNGLIDLLLKQASSLLDSDWSAAEPFVNEAAGIEPKNALAKSLKTLIADKKQNEEVALCLSQARTLQGDGKSRDAIRVIDQTLALYPRETRLIQLRASLGHGLSTNERDELRTKDLEELRKLEAQSLTLTDVRGLDTILDRTRVFRTKYAGDKDFNDSITAIEERATTSGRKVPVEPVKLDNSWESGGRGGSTPPQKGAPKPGPAAAPAAQGAAPLAGSKQLIYGLLGAAAAGLLLYLGISYTQKDVPAAAIATRVPIAVTIEPATTYRIEDAAGKDVTTDSRAAGLPPADYRLKATRPGFAPIDLAFKVQSGEKQHAVSPVWNALPFRLVLRTTLPGEAKLDGAPLSPGADGDLVADLANGSHMLTWAAATSGTELEVNVDNGVISHKPWGPSFGAILVTTGLQKINYESFKLGLLGGRAPSGEINLPAPGETAEIGIGGNPSAILGRVDDTRYSGSLLVYLLPRAGGRGKGKSTTDTSAASEPAAAPIPNASPAAPSAPVESEADKKLRETQERLNRRINQGKQ